jgi:lipopolysaccharide biosynthesis regulator YciM
MEKSLFESFKDDFSLLVEAGFVAVKQLDEVSAKRLFLAAKAVSPNHTAPDIGLGYIALNKLDIKEATRILTDVVEREPSSALASTFLGMCYLLTKSKRAEGEALIQKIMKETEDKAILNLCQISLEWAEKDLKKIKAPFLEQKEEETPLKKR